MLSRAVRNLEPKFNQYSKIPNNVRKHIDEVLLDPVKLPNFLGVDTKYKKTQFSSYKINKPICEYNMVNINGLNNYFKNYKESKLLWEKTSFSDKKDVFLKTADLIENKYYEKMLAYTILGQNKNVYEAEIDSICELVDFLRFNVHYAETIIEKQPIQTDYIKNISEYNSLNGFVASITPFNFTAIGGNLASAPLLFGNSVLWKPSDNAVLSNYLFYKIMLEAGLPQGVLNFCPMNPEGFLDVVTKHKELSLLLFTGSSKVLEDIYTKVGSNIKNYNNFPRIVGESGGKNFHFLGTFTNNINENIENVVEKTIESSFNYSGQKCSASSIVYVPENYLDLFIDKMCKNVDMYVERLENYGLINNVSFFKTRKLIDELENDSKVDLVYRGKIDNLNSYYIEPHVFLCRDHDHKVFKEEFFAPVLTIFPYNKNDMTETVRKCLSSNNYALTGSVFSDDEIFLNDISFMLRHKTGNFYVNDKSTGSVVGQQPFGGGGKSGTNDKAGDINLLYKMFNQRNIKRKI